MINLSRITLSNFLSSGHSRSVQVKKSILLSIFIKGGSIAANLMLIPLTIKYINASQYGIWLTLSSIVSWFSFFDIGLTNGFRNKFSEARSNGDNELARVYVSTTYVALALIFSLIWVLFLVINHFLNWTQILHISSSMEAEISILMTIIFTYFCLQFVLRVVSTLLIADQQPAKASLIDLISQIICVCSIFVLVHTTEGSLIRLGITLCLVPVVVLIAANLYYFNGKFRNFRPSFSRAHVQYLKGLLSLGTIFFVIQIASIVQYETANVIIARNFGPAEVTSYNIVYRYFGILHMGFMIFVMPFWSACTEAYHKQDYEWIRKGIRKYNQLNGLLFLVGCVMLLCSDWVYRMWLGAGAVQIDFKTSLFGFLFFNVGIFGTKYVHFLNGINALRMQFVASLITPVLYIGLSMMMIHYFHLGVYSLFIAAIIVNVNAFILAPLQYHMIITKGKRGIWVR